MLRRLCLFFFVGLFTCTILFGTVPAYAQATPVELRQTGEGWELLRDGKPYHIRGVGGNQYLELLVESGGNSIRTWGVGDDTQSLLDEAHRLGLSVTLGIWLGHERHGFDYNNLDQVAQQFQAVREAVLAYKDHPAVLAWGIGNEMEGFGAGDNSAIWSHIEACAAMVKTLDPGHPTMTVIAEIGGRKVEAINRLCPSIDIIGINSYGGAPSIPQRYRAMDSTKPYIITEFGHPGSWEIGEASFGAVEELTSTQKAEAYAANYRAFEADADQCLGSYVFLWGSKVEATTTWFGMFLSNGSKVAPVDAMAHAWSGDWPADRCPTIEPLTLSANNTHEPGATVRVELSASDPEGNKLTAEWTLMADPLSYNTGGDNVAAPPSFPRLITRADDEGCELTLPDVPGVYRISVIVRDKAGNAATANLPLHVAGAAPTNARAITLPAIVYAEDGEDARWVASGYMGNNDAITMTPDHADNPHAGETCLRVGYSARDQWGGVVWQSPANDWGDVDGGYNLSGATVLELWARGEVGGEVITFGFGILNADVAFPDSGNGKIDAVALTDQWKKYTIRIPASTNLGRIKTGFYWSLAGSGQPITFYLDDVIFRAEPTED